MTLLLNWGVHQLMKKYFFKFNYNKNLFRMDLGSEKGSDKKVKKTTIRLSILKVKEII